MTEDELDQLEAGLVRLKGGVCVSSDLEVAAADAIARLRAELAAGNARIMELERIEEVYRNRKPIVYSPDAQAMSDRAKAAEAERDALRAELAYERVQHKSVHEMLCKEVDELEAERDALREALAELLVTHETIFPDRPATARARAALKEPQP